MTVKISGLKPLFSTIESGCRSSTIILTTSSSNSLFLLESFLYGVALLIVSMKGCTVEVDGLEDLPLTLINADIFFRIAKLDSTNLNLD